MAIQEPTKQTSIRDMQIALDNFKQAGLELNDAWEIAQSLEDSEISLNNYPEYLPSFDEFIHEFGTEVIIYE